MKSIETIIETLKNTDNEGTDAPYWIIIDPENIADCLKVEDQERKEDLIEELACHLAYCFTGPFFSRQDAEDHLKARRYHFSDKTIVWCASGYWSKKYKDFCKELKIGF